MKNLFFPLFLLLFVVSCSKDSVTETATSLEERGKEQKITVCHRNGQGEFQPISISQNALAAHLAHGDYNPDADGDGHTAPGSCTGDGLDCDDTNPEVWENCCGEECQLASETLLNCIGGWYGYISSEECPDFFGGATNAVLLVGENGIMIVGNIEGQYVFGYETNVGLCLFFVGEEEEEFLITLEEWQESYNAILDYIDNNPSLINGCEQGLVSKSPASLKPAENNKFNKSVLLQQVKLQFQELKNQGHLNKDR